eukprot:2370002-Pleurochrysis_carterae.AAC.1
MNCACGGAWPCGLHAMYARAGPCLRDANAYARMRTCIGHCTVAVFIFCEQRRGLLIDYLQTRKLL